MSGSSGWTCDACGRTFGRRGQSHDCAPGLTLEEYFETGPPHERPIFDEVLRRLEPLGPIHLDVVAVGIFLKNPRTFAQLRPMDRWVAIWFPLRRRATHRTITRKVAEQAGTYWHVANVASPADVDDELVALLTEAYTGTAT